jgi:hypothetical protein
LPDPNLPLSIPHGAVIAIAAASFAAGAIASVAGFGIGSILTPPVYFATAGGQMLGVQGIGGLRARRLHALARNPR